MIIIFQSEASTYLTIIPSKADNLKDGKTTELILILVCVRDQNESLVMYNFCVLYVKGLVDIDLRSPNPTLLLAVKNGNRTRPGRPLWVSRGALSDFIISVFSAQ